MYDETEVVNYGSTAHDQESQPLKGNGGVAAPQSSYVTLEELGPKRKRPMLKFLAAGFLVAAVVLSVFVVASGTLGRWFGVDECVGGPTQCDLRTVVNSFCPDRIPCKISNDCGDTFECRDAKKPTQLGVECKPGECFCQAHLCGLSMDGKVLNLGGIKIGPEGGKKLAKPLAWDTTVKDVRLWKTGLEDEGAASLAAAVATHPTIESLNVANNGFTDKACKALGDAIAKNTNIEELNLSDNEIANKGAKLLAEGLKQNNSMRVFNLFQNSIGEQGALYMADAFKYNLDLRKLYLTDNNIDNGGLGSEALTTASDSRDNLEITFDQFEMSS